MKWWVVVVLFLVGCREAKAPAKTPKQTKPKQVVAKPVPAKVERKAPLTEDQLFGLDESSASSVPPLTREQYEAALARQAAAKQKQEEKEDAEALLSPEEREGVPKIRAALEEHGLWGVSSFQVVFAATGYGAPLLEDDLIRASKKRDPKLEIDRLLDSLNLDSGDRIIFAASYDLADRIPIAETLVAMHDGTWSGSEEAMFRYRGKPFFDDAIKAFKKKKQ